MDRLFESSYERDDFLRHARIVGEDADPKLAKSTVLTFVKGFTLKCRQEGYHRQAVAFEAFAKRIVSVGWEEALDEISHEIV